jgi:hypothetical protein
MIALMNGNKTPSRPTNASFVEPCPSDAARKTTFGGYLKSKILRLDRSCFGDS